MIFEHILEIVVKSSNDSFSRKMSDKLFIVDGFEFEERLLVIVDPSC